MIFNFHLCGVASGVSSDSSRVGTFILAQG
jgi:hypothetical protein